MLDELVSFVAIDLTQEASLMVDVLLGAPACSMLLRLEGVEVVEERRV